MSFFNPEFYPWESIKKPEEVKMEELKVTKERVLKASEKCGEAKTILKELFPEVFKEKGICIDVVDNPVKNGFFLIGDSYSLKITYRSDQHRRWNIMEFRSNGSVERYGGLPSDIGFELDGDEIKIN